MRLTILIALAGLSLGISIAPLPAQADDVYYTVTFGGSPTFTGEVLAIRVSEDKVTTTDIGSTDAPFCASLAMSKSRILYSMCGPLFGSQQLATIDLTTGHATLFGTLVNGLAVMAMTFGPDGTLYAVGNCNPNAQLNACGATALNYNTLYSVDAGGNFHRIGPTNAPEFFMDLAFDRHGHLFGVTTTLAPSSTPAVLYQINPTTGASSKVVNLIGSSQVMGLAFGEDGTLYGTDFVDNPGLYRIDMKTGFETAIAALPRGLSSGLELVRHRDKDHHDED